ncbi:MAG: hypothetical protein MJB12_14615 [Firmicutes bacterium]|nr:hypothetical protein [Bacillota bacterium]
MKNYKLQESYFAEVLLLAYVSKQRKIIINSSHMIFQINSVAIKASMPLNIPKKILGVSTLVKRGIPLDK